MLRPYYVPGLCTIWKAGYLDQILGNIPENIKYEDKGSQKVHLIYFTKIKVEKFPVFQSL